jgi:hypothetical protein
MAMEMDAPVNVGLEETTKGLDAVEEEDTTINFLDEDAMVIDLICSLDESNDKMSDDDIEILEEL